MSVDRNRAEQDVAEHDMSEQGMAEQGVADRNALSPGTSLAHRLNAARRKRFVGRTGWALGMGTG